MLSFSMDFSFEKPSHIFALLLLFISIFFIFLLPVVTFIMFYGTDYIDEINISEVSAILSQLIVIAVAQGAIAAHNAFGMIRKPYWYKDEEWPTGSC